MPRTSVLLIPSPQCRARIAADPYPLRGRYRYVHADPALHALKPPLESWVGQGATLHDLLAVRTEASVRKLLPNLPLVVLRDTPLSLLPFAQQVIALGNTLPRVIVLPEGTFPGQFARELEELGEYGIIVVPMGQDVERLAARCVSR